MSSKAKVAQRMATIKQALELPDRFEALTAIREAIPERNEAQKQVVLAYACILEASSAGLSIVLERFDDDELDQMEAVLEALGAEATLADLRRLRAAVSPASGSGK